MTTSEMLEQRHELFLEWWEPWPALSVCGNETSAHMSISATVHDCINLHRKNLMDSLKPYKFSDEELLHSFIAVHWARPVEETE